MRYGDDAVTEARLALDAAEMAGAARAKVIEFCRLLRMNGFQAGLRESQDALRTADLFLCTDFSAFHAGMRSLLCCSRREWELFDRLFEGFWCPPDGPSVIRATRATPMLRKQVAPGTQQMTTGLSPRREGMEEDRTLSGASDLEVLRRQDFALLGRADQDRLDLLAMRLWQRMALNIARRLRGWRWKTRIDFRRTIRRNLPRGGDPVQLVLSGRKRKKPRLVVLLDVSGSLELYSFVFLRLLFSLQRRFRRVSSFVFSTDLAEVTRALGARKLDAALEAVSGLRLGWNGGTRIGDSLWRLIDEHGERVFRRDSVFIVLSDGLDVGPPERLAEALGRIRGRVGKIVWMNPLLGMDGYEPTARGMAAALPLLDVFAPAHNLDSFLDIKKYLMT